MQLKFELSQRGYEMYKAVSVTVFRAALCFFAVSKLCMAAEATNKSAQRLNVLFIPVDDLNHWCGYTGRNQQAQTPNIDRLSRMGVSFLNAHCAAPACGPSRAALFSGLRPSTSGCYHNDDPWKKQDKPFFLACGMIKPHLPWAVPRKYYEMFPRDETQLQTEKQEEKEESQSLRRLKINRQPL